MKILGISFVLILLLGSIVTPIGFLSAFADVESTHKSASHLVTFTSVDKKNPIGKLQFNGASSLTGTHGMTSEKVTGGGHIGKGVNFGFNVNANGNGTKKIRGELEYNDRNLKTKLHSINMTSLSIDQTLTHASFGGNGKVNGTSGFKFSVSITDADKTGEHDTFSISITDASGHVIYQNSGQVRGHIEIHVAHVNMDHKVTPVSEKNGNEKEKLHLSAKNNLINNQQGKNNHKTGKHDN